MSKTIKIQSTKNGFKVVKTKAIANEKYIIADGTGKPLNKLKFVQKDKNLEIYTDVNGKEQQIVTLEDYYAPDMNASVVGLNENIFDMYCYGMDREGFATDDLKTGNQYQITNDISEVEFDKIYRYDTN